MRRYPLGFILLWGISLAGCALVSPEPPTPTLTATPLILTATLPPPITRAPSPTVFQISTVTPDLNATPTPAPTHTVTPIPPSATPVPLAILSFTISPAEIRPGGDVTLTWEARGEQVVIYQLDAQGRLTMPAYNVPLAGSLTLTTSELLRNQISFVVFAFSGGSSAQAGVFTLITCPDVWFFANPPPRCPGSPPHTTLMQAQSFERGLMLWMQWNDFIYILYADEVAAPRWEARLDAWFSGLPDSDPNLTPPTGLYQPVRGFGLTWRDEQVAEGYRVRDRVGWAMAPEFGVDNAAYQCDSAPKYNTCFISGPGGVVYELKPEESAWQVWAGPN